MSSKKHPVPKALSYAALYPFLAMQARHCGYALAVHGSLATDLDVVAVPWTDEATTAEELVEQLTKYTGLSLRDTDTSNGRRNDKPHGRRVWTLHWNEPMCGMYVDLSVTPRRNDNKARTERIERALIEALALCKTNAADLVGLGQPRAAEIVRENISIIEKSVDKTK